MTTPTAPADDITLPAPLQIDWPELNAQALGCGVEDRDLHDRYECAEYGWQDGVDRAAQCVPDDIYTSDMVREIVAADRASPSRALPVAWAATDEDGNVEALGMNQSRRFDTPLYTRAQHLAAPLPAAVDVGAAAPKGGQDEFDAWRQS